MQMPKTRANVGTSEDWVLAIKERKITERGRNKGGIKETGIKVIKVYWR